MKRLILAFVFAFGPAAAFADEPATEEQAEKIQQELQSWGCEGGEMSRENGSDHYEIDDAECPHGEFDFKLNEEFHTIFIHRH